MPGRNGIQNRIAALFRASATPSNVGFPPVNTDGAPIMALVDRAGVIYTKTVAATSAGVNTVLSTITQALLSTTSAVGALFVSGPGNWSITSNPAQNAQATITKAGVAGVAHVCNSISGTLSGTAASGIVKLYLRDGVSGVGAILWSANMLVPLGGSEQVSISGLNIIGTPGNAMTLEFSGAGGANTQENVSLTGYDVS